MTPKAPLLPKEGWQPLRLTGWFSRILVFVNSPMTYKRSRTDIHNLPELRTFRTKLRSNLTPAEASFWNLVKNSRLDGRKFRRQHSVGKYILDFYCPSEHIGIELDGEVHNSDHARQHDFERRLFLEQFGILIIRFENRLVFEDREYVANTIRSFFGWRETDGRF